MSSNQDVNVSHCIVELSPTKQDSTFFDSSLFIFQSSECRVKINYGWETNDERKIKIFLKSKPLLSPNFYATISLIKGSHFISYPKKQVQEPIKCIWSLSASDIAKQFPGVEKWDLTFKLEFQQVAESNYDRKNSGNKFVQTSSYLNENCSIEKMSDDFARLLDGDTKYDIELKSGDIVIKAHRAVLRARSKFFEKILQSATENQRIELQYIDPAAFNEIIRYMYTAKSPDLSYEVAKRIYKAGEICNTGCLKERCEEFLLVNLTLDNACECLALAEDDCFKERVVKFIIDKDIPFLDEYWKPFCDQHPTLANNVLNKLIRALVIEMRQRRA